VRARRFGWAPLVSVCLVVVIAGGMSLLDLKRWNRRRSQFVGLSWPFVVFIAFNCATALAIFVVLAESGRASWDGWLVAVGVGLGYSALLKTTLFQTQVGDEIGFSSWYGRVVQWINDKIMVEKWRRESHKVNYVAYRNNLDRLEDCVCEVYQGYGADAAENDERVKELRDEAELCPTTLQKRQVWARRALTIMRWSDLQAKGLVRSGLTEAQVGKVIEREAFKLGWIVERKRPGRMVASLKLRSHWAVVDITYDASQYSIHYKESEQLEYNGEKIHRNYNNWILNLQRKINAAL